MEILTALIAGVLGVAILSWFLLAPLTQKQKKEIRQITNEELGAEVFRYEKDYFSFIGEQEPEVKEYKNLIERRDFDAIRRNWRRLSGAFVGLERKAGHSGRPLIMDYYLWYEISLKEMKRRRR
jgi:hypothetical protein